MLRKSCLMVVIIETTMMAVTFAEAGEFETAIEGMKLGAYDFLMKSTETEDLVEKITKAYKLKSEHDERIRNAEINNIIKRRGW